MANPIRTSCGRIVDKFEIVHWMLGCARLSILRRNNGSVLDSTIPSVHLIMPIKHSIKSLLLKTCKDCVDGEGIFVITCRCGINGGCGDSHMQATDRTTEIITKNGG